MARAPPTRDRRTSPHPYFVQLLQLTEEALAGGTDVASDSGYRGQSHQRLLYWRAGCLIRHSAHDVIDEPDCLLRYDLQALLFDLTEVSGIRIHVVFLGSIAASLH